MENNNNGRGIFYGVIGVATLVVAIIGATFAYFSASVNTGEVLNIKSTTLNLEIVNEATNYKTNLIPVETAGDKGTLFARYPGVDTTSTAGTSYTCLDDLGNDICSVYSFAIKNPSGTTAQTVKGSLTVSANGFARAGDGETPKDAGNLYYAVFKGAANVSQGVASSGVITSYNVNGTASDTQTIVNDVVTGNAAPNTVIVPRTKLDVAGTIHNWEHSVERLMPGEQSYYTVVVWLEDTKSNQDADQNQGFAALISYTSDTGGGVTGVISAG